MPSHSHHGTHPYDENWGWCPPFNQAYEALRYGYTPQYCSSQQHDTQTHGNNSGTYRNPHAPPSSSSHQDHRRRDNHAERSRSPRRSASVSHSQRLPTHSSHRRRSSSVRPHASSRSQSRNLITTSTSNDDHARREDHERRERNREYNRQYQARYYAHRQATDPEFKARNRETRRRRRWGDAEYERRLREGQISYYD
ncbi:hypothetical protein LTR70_007010 [Exophiala xenobiotica]|uniref:Uncharacterized protein n=1 Tax=Lithohypha guttulata TaxID=1690604 RepID=A0ABR0K4S3_9EURO|nr:hypothetical protein LTR24_006873 [Lithohypha guttulata]KAK5314711.1 hypothetical protein LTR70_007010 [Exophiala xenobiotica]